MNWEWFWWALLILVFLSVWEALDILKEKVNCTCDCEGEHILDPDVELQISAAKYGKQLLAETGKSYIIVNGVKVTDEDFDNTIKYLEQLLDK